MGAGDLEIVLALVRAGNLAGAGERLGVDASTVFRSIRRIERGLGQRLFERSRAGYLPSEQAQVLAEHAEQVESRLEQARSAVQLTPEQVSGTVRITTTDTILHGLIAPALRTLATRHPLLDYELHTGNELTSLTRREADIAVRATKKPPQHLVGKHIGPIRVALYASRGSGIRRHQDVEAGKAAWIAPDDALPEHPSVLWRKRHHPKAVPRYRVNSILTVMELVAAGMGVGVLPVFLAQPRKDLIALTDILDECQTELWLLTHPESRHLRRVSTVFRHLGEHLNL
ncbi:LysR family transcriptional regulator [Stenotrophomonas sp. GD03993]|uniref:LysR family transcriptional regulator n=1 Tax=unclassified Stenotrophomonas TaxID=196198 RepID=UPI00244C5D72|nr:MULTISPECIES: LysR family transcriptional regulator [unclassified Stenotrophomonas]MDH0187851.1 LysR family transcriptional regulator [Stenotrophomonas sp. GD04051]MDH0463675.1 LysR family transcriptional regulator [Stenotrophomonas sp. GD03993]MDH0877472.1 LysR family transcriptional regulator [Stenotrophomonas sp. GD03877]MDH2154929.1 LysR family transcriptional regulator [Stenotrophomonas sp. GD03657]